MEPDPGFLEKKGPESLNQKWTTGFGPGYPELDQNQVWFLEPEPDTELGFCFVEELEPL
jgi:hypothetical protein